MCRLVGTHKLFKYYASCKFFLGGKLKINNVLGKYGVRVCSGNEVKSQINNLW